jgi:hypothetical protein
MGLGEIIVALRKDAAGLSRPDSMEHAAAALIGIGALPTAEARVVRKILYGLLRGMAADFTESDLAALGPLALGALDRVLEDLLNGFSSEKQLQDALRPLLVGQLKHVPRVRGHGDVTTVAGRYESER